MTVTGCPFAVGDTVAFRHAKYEPQVIVGTVAFIYSDRPCCSVAVTDPYPQEPGDQQWPDNVARWLVPWKSLKPVSVPEFEDWDSAPQSSSKERQPTK